MIDEIVVEREYKSHMFTYAATGNTTVKTICRNVCFVLGGILGIPRKDTIEEMNRYVDFTQYKKLGEINE